MCKVTHFFIYVWSNHVRVHRRTDAALKTKGALTVNATFTSVKHTLDFVK